MNKTMFQHAPPGKATLALLTLTTLVAAGCSSNSNDPVAPAPMVNGAPGVTLPTNRSADQDTVVGPIEFGVDDRESPAGDLLVSVSVDNNAVFPPDGIALGGTGARRTLTLTPLEAATGTTAIRLTVADPAGATTTRSFSVTVNERRASLRDSALQAFAKAEDGEANTVNGLTFDQDADDPALFEALIGPGDE